MSIKKRNKKEKKTIGKYFYPTKKRKIMALENKFLKGVYEC